MNIWRQAGWGMPRTVRHVPGSENHVVQIEDELADAALLSARAALWSGATAVSRPGDIHGTATADRERRDSNTAPKLGQRPDAGDDDAATDEATDKQTAA